MSILSRIKCFFGFHDANFRQGAYCDICSKSPYNSTFASRLKCFFGRHQFLDSTGCSVCKKSYSAISKKTLFGVIYGEESYSQIARGAMEGLDDSRLIKLINEEDSLNWRSKAAISNLNNQKDLLKIAQDHPNEYVCANVVLKLNDKSILQNMMTTDVSDVIKGATAERLYKLGDKNEDVLMNLVCYSEEDELCEAVFNKLFDKKKLTPEELAHIASKICTSSVRDRILSKLKDQKLIADIAIANLSDNIIDRITSNKELARVALSSSWSDSIYAVNKILKKKALGALMEYALEQIPINSDVPGDFKIVSSAQALERVLDASKTHPYNFGYAGLEKSHFSMSLNYHDGDPQSGNSYTTYTLMVEVYRTEQGFALNIKDEEFWHKAEW